MHENRKLFTSPRYRGLRGSSRPPSLSADVCFSPFYKILDPRSAIGREIMVVLHEWYKLPEIMMLLLMMMMTTIMMLVVVVVVMMMTLLHALCYF